MLTSPAQPGSPRGPPSRPLSWPTSAGTGFPERICNSLLGSYQAHSEPPIPCGLGFWTWPAPLGEGAGMDPWGQECAMGLSFQGQEPLLPLRSGECLDTEGSGAQQVAGGQGSESPWASWAPTGGPEVPMEKESSYTEVTHGESQQRTALPALLSPLLPLPPYILLGSQRDPGSDPSGSRPSSLTWGPHQFLFPTIAVGQTP